ncbi:hypothetical protein HPB50_023985 [Hyalomma asiaticum]|uniref:Uncharacterized protein n=1 Tax=Hyalomma asiaticum TaxID=266040 RepID=A0ACB7S547_HYAAI|nr:hypothetical protein HPB50_023985 [Hyalomma asiaticum]
MQHTSAFAEDDDDDINFTADDGDFATLPAGAGSRVTALGPSSSWCSPDDSQQLHPRRGRFRSRGRSCSRGGGGGRSRSRGRSGSRVPAVRIAVQQDQHQTWASKVKSPQPQVKGGTYPEPNTDILVQMQRENASLRALVEQLRVEIADLRKSQQVPSPSPPITNPGTVAASTTILDEVPMDIQPGAKPTKRRALAKPSKEEDSDFKAQIKDSLDEIKNALKAVVQSIAALDSRVTAIEAHQAKFQYTPEATPTKGTSEAGFLSPLPLERGANETESGKRVAPVIWFLGTRSSRRRRD